PAQIGQLAAPVFLLQAKVHANRMYVRVPARRLQDAMQEAALLVTAYGDIDVVVARDGEFGQHGIAVMAMGIDGIAPVGVVSPYRIGQELILAGGGPAGKLPGMVMMRPQHLLQKDDVRMGSSYGIAQFMQDEATIENRKALVRVYGKYF